MQAGRPNRSKTSTSITHARKPTLLSPAYFSDSAVKNDSSEVSVDDDTNEVNSAEGVGTEDTSEDDTPSVEVADEPYVPQASVEELGAAAAAADGDGDSKEDAEGDKDEIGDEQAADETAEDNDEGDSKEEATADEQAAETGKEMSNK